jgi:hypothetical protein
MRKRSSFSFYKTMMLILLLFIAVQLSSISIAVTAMARHSPVPQRLHGDVQRTNLAGCGEARYNPCYVKIVP